MPQPQPPVDFGSPKGGPGTKRPKPGPGANPANPQGANVGSDPNSPCLISSPHLPLVGSVGGGCILSKTNVRAMIGGALLGIGGILFLGGVVVLVAAGFKRSGALDKTAGAIGAVPLPQAQVAAAGLRAAGRPPKGGSKKKRAAASERALESRVGEPRENENLREGKGAIRETPAGTRRRKAETGTGVKPATREEAGF